MLVSSMARRAGHIGLLAALIAGCGSESDPAAPGSAGGSGGGSSSSDGGSGSGGGNPAATCGPVVQGVRCFDDGWCWDAPRPRGGALRGIDGSPDGTSVWAVGDGGLALHRCEGAWQPIDTGTDVTLHDVWQPDPTFGIAVGDEGTVLTWDGSAWSKLPAPTDASLRSVWGARADDVWIGGVADDSGTTLLHFDGATLTRVAVEASYDVLDIHGHGPDDVFAVGGSWEYDQSMHFDGSTWTQLPFAHGGHDFGPFTHVVAQADGSTFALFAGYNTSAIYAFDGADWREDESVLKRDGFRALFRDASGHASVLHSSSSDEKHYDLLRFEGGEWNPTGETLPKVGPHAGWAPPGGGEAWVIGERTSLLGRFGGGWSQAPEVAAITAEAVFIGGKSIADLWLMTESEVLHRDAGGWKPMGSMENLRGGSIDLEGRPYALQANDVVVYLEGSDWKTLPKIPVSVAPQLLANAPDDVWALDQYGYPVHFNGSTWRVYGYQDKCTRLGSTSGPTDNPQGDRFARAPDGTVWLVSWSTPLRGLVYFDPATETCSFLKAPSSAFIQDIAWQGNELFAVTYGGDLYRRDGSELVLLGNVVEGGDVAVENLSAVDGGKLRISYVQAVPDTQEYALWTRTIIPTYSDPPKVGTPLRVPDFGHPGLVWMPDAEHTVAATWAGVLTHGYGK